MSDSDDHDVYSPEFLSMLQSIWGDGFLSPGGEAAVAAILDGVEAAGRDVLDIGSGLGGPSFLLARRHGAARVVGIEVQAPLVEQARAAAERIGLGGRVAFETVAPGPLPFADSSFDLVFSKDSIIHVSDKTALAAEIHRVLRPGGRLALGDWFGGHAPLSAEAEAWLEATGLSFALKPIEDMAAVLDAAGFREVTTEDRNAWYREQATRDIAHLEGEGGRRLAEAIGEAGARQWLERSRKRAVVAEQGHLRPGHIKARKPA